MFTLRLAPTTGGPSRYHHFFGRYHDGVYDAGLLVGCMVPRIIGTKLRYVRYETTE